MSNYIINPNLPESSVSSLIFGGLNEDIISYFNSRGIRIYFTEKNYSVDEAISRHCDIFAFYLGKGRIIVDNQQLILKDELIKDGFEVIESYNSVKGLYPGDVILNHAIVGKHIFGKLYCFDKSVTENTIDLKAVDVKQGYAKCSVLVVDENSVITDDESIAQKASEIGLNCLLVRKGDILLDGHEYGFIGGASGKISNNEIVFFGDIKKHRDYLRIKEFLSVRSIKFVNFDFPLTDFGGIIPLTEK